jgi:hypothetical protein
MLLRTLWRNDVRRWRRLTRPLLYAAERLDYTRLTGVRAKMAQHVFVDKEAMAASQQANPQEWRWVVHLRPERVRKYGRFWRPQD